MNQIKHFGRKFIKGTFKFLIGIILFFAGLFISILIALQIPYVQTKIVNEATEYFSQVLGFPITLEGVQIDWLDELVLEKVSVTDPRGGKMISLNEVVVDFEIISITKAKFNIDEVTLRNGRVNMIRYAPDGMSNMTEFIDIIRELTTPKVPRKKPVPFTIDEVTLDNMYFSYFDKRKIQITEGFDHNHFSFDSIYATIDGLKSVADTFQLNIKNLRAVENNIHLPVHNITTLFTVTKSDMTFDKLVASVGKSYVKDYLRFNYTNINDLSDFNTKVEVVSYLHDTYVDFHDLAYFAPELKGIKDKVRFNGFVKGQVNDFTAKDVTMFFGKKSKIEGNLSFDGLPNFEETSIHLKFNSLSINPEDLKPYITENALQVLSKFGYIKGKGEFQGFPSDFVTYGNFQTNLGYLSCDIKLGENDNGTPVYLGKLITNGFEIGKLLNVSSLQMVDMNGQVDGEGFNVETAKVNFDGKISRLGINGYIYRNITADAQLKKSYIEGLVQVADSNLLLTANGKVDLSKDNEEFDLVADIKRANLKAINLSPVEARLESKLALNFSGTNLDSIIGEAKFKETILSYANKHLTIDTLYILSEKDQTGRKLVLNSDLLSFNASGDFHYSALFQDLEVLFQEYKINFTNNIRSIKKYYSIKGTKGTDRYYVNFDLNVKNLNDIFEIYVPGLYLSENLIASGSFHNGVNSQFNLNTSIDTIYYRGNEFYNNQLDVSTSKIVDSTNILAMLYVASERQKVTDLPETRHFVFEGIWDQNIIDFTTRLSQQDSDNQIDLNGSLNFLESERLLHFNNSFLHLLGQKWNIQEENRIHLSARNVLFENFSIKNNEEFITFNGTLSEKENETATLEVGNFNLSSLGGVLIENDLDGILNGRMEIKDIYNNLDIAGNVMVSGLTVDGFPIGEVKGKSSWDKEKQRLILTFDLERQGEITAVLKGYISPRTKDSPEEIKMNAYMENADLAVISPLMKDVLSDISGRVNGNIQIQGSFDNIGISGKADVTNGKFKIDYLGTTYYFNDPIYLEENKIVSFKKLKLKDEYGNIGIINGGIFHDGFRDFLVDIRGTLQSISVLNTTEKDNELFYGNAFVTGDFDVIGPFSDLKISSNAISNKGTKIYIPLNTYEGVEQQDHIKFVARSKGATRDDQENKVDLSGLNLDFNFEITPDAYAELIFDKRSGDIIRGYGNGNIKMTIDTRGDFNMFGNYRIAKGAYNYMLAGLINREFTIEPNSSIVWTGDPYQGILDVKAYYENKVSIIPLLIDSSRIKQEQGRTHPVKVILDLDGVLTSPEIGLDIDITPTTTTATEVATSFEAEIKRNDQELNKQVFSLLVLGNFSPANSFAGVGGSTTNVSQLLTNQLGNWLSQVDENLVIDIDLNGLDKDALNTFNLRLSYTLLDGRLRVSRDGSFSNFQSTQQQNLSNIAGEWTVEYLLSKEGKFRLKLYNKNNQNLLLNSLNAGSYSSAGFSILHTQTFNNLNDLLGLNKKKKEEVPSEKIPKEDENKDTPPSDTSSTRSPATTPKEND